MNTLQRYIARQVLFTLIVSVSVFSAVLLAGDAVKQLMDLFSSGQVPTWLVFRQLFYLVPFVLTFSLPMGVMTTCLLVFGRLSADNEINAMRACGQSFWQLISPVLLMGFLLSLACLYFNMLEAPRLKMAFKDSLVRLGFSYPTVMMDEGRFNDTFDGCLVYVGHVGNNNSIRDVTIYKLDEAGNVTQKIRAINGELQPDLEHNKLAITLHKVQVEQRDTKDPNNVAKIRPDIQADNYEIILDITKRLEAKTKRRDVAWMTFSELVGTIFDLKKRGIDPTPYVVRAHKQWVVSFSCLAFAMIGIPCGIRAHRRETSIGVTMALGLAFVYYFFVILAEAFSNKPVMFPELMIWLPNLAFQFIGLLLLWRISRVGAV